jgi:hypothetical protein
MSKITEIQGLWRVVAYEEDGLIRPESGVQAMARMLIMRGSVGAEADGIWGIIAYTTPPTYGMICLSIQSLKCLIDGQPYQRNEQFHIYTGGRVFFGLDNTIDLAVYHGPYLHSVIGEKSISRGIYRHDGNALYLCLADPDTEQRPTTFSSTETPHQSLAVYILDHDLDG